MFILLIRFEPIMLVYNGIEIDLYGELTETNGLLSKKKKTETNGFYY